jgi:hypothetical protein
MKTIVAIILINTSLCCFSQNNTMVEQYCSVSLNSVMFSKKLTMEIDYGGRRNDSTDRRVTNEKGEPIKFNSFVDAVNYMGKLGWKLAPYFSNLSGNYFVFKKEMELQEANKTGTVAEQAGN